MFHPILFGLITTCNVIEFIFKNYNKKYYKSISLFFHLYFCVFSTFIYKDEDIIYCSYIYFTADSIINSYFKTFKTFNKYHHLLVFIFLFFHENIDKKILNYCGMHEFSTIILCLIDTDLITKKQFEILFPISFVMCRIILFNYYVLNYLYYNDINMFTTFGLIVLNIMNIGITVKMKLLQKIFKILN